MMPSRPLLVVTCAALLLASCAGDLDGADDYAVLPVSSAIRPANTYAPAPRGAPVTPTGMGCDEAVTIMQTLGKCGGPACHGSATEPPPSAVADFSGDPALLPAKLKAYTSTMQCAGRPVLDTANPMESLLITKIKEPPCGLKMPVGPPLSAEEVQCIVDWAMEAAATP